MKLILIYLGLVGLSGCGVKGDPLPPEKPTFLGSGTPNSKIEPTQKMNPKINFEYDEEEDKDKK